MFFTGFLRVAGEDAYRWSKSRIRAWFGYPAETEPRPKPRQISLVSLPDIVEELERTAPLLRGEVAKRYEGLLVRWPCLLASAYPRGNEVDLHLEAANVRTYVVSCVVKAGDYPELPFLHRGAPITVIGEIRKVKSLTTDLDAVRLEFPATDDPM